MGDQSAIEWTDATWNPVTGCDRVSEGCTNCYALNLAKRLKAMGNPRYQADGNPKSSGPGFRVVLHEDILSLPLTWRRPRFVFVNSMSDLFHEKVPDEYIELCVKVMAAANWHTYQVLTKRSERLRSLLQTNIASFARLPHIWWGVSVENKKHGLPRIEHLRAAAPAMAFLSIEPLLEDIGRIDLNGIDWVIVGGESGPGARPMNREWVIGIQKQCQRARVPFFFKQWGGIRKKQAGRMLDGRLFNEFPDRPFSTGSSSLIRNEAAAKFRKALPRHLSFS